MVNSGYGEKKIKRSLIGIMKWKYTKWISNIAFQRVQTWSRWLWKHFEPLHVTDKVS
jgi:hypothetical protein